MKQEIELLREEIRNHEYRYYVENAPVISDQEFDALMHKLIKLEEENPDSYYALEFIYNKALYTVLNIDKISSDKKIIITDM